MAEATAGSGASRERPILVLDNKPRSRSTVVWDLWRYRDVLYELARTDFQVRYKRAIFGILWAVALPLLQAAVLAFVFSRVIRLAPGAQHGFAVFVLSGVLAWSYFSITVSLGSTAIVDNAELTDKLWFPRSMLPIVPALGGLVGLGVSMVALVVAMPILGVAIGPQVLLLVPACVILVLISIALSLVLASLHVYFRDVRYLVSAALLVWFYLTPILYPPQLLHGLANVLDFNPMTGVLLIFRTATVGPDSDWHRPLIVSLVTMVVCLALALEIYRRRDRLFADEL